MKKIFTYIALLVVGLPLIALILGWYFFVKPIGEQRINAFIKDSNIPLSGEPLNLFFLGLRSDNPLNFRFGPFPLTFENTSLSISPFSLFSLAPKATLISKLLDGEIKGSASYSNSNKKINTEISAEQLQLAKYQLASMLGITSGTLDLFIDSEGNENMPIQPKQFFIKLKNFKKPLETKLPTWISPLGIKLPAIENAEFITEGSCDNIHCQSEKLSFISSLGQASGSLTIPFSPQDEIKGNITVSLTQAGKTSLLPYFALLNQNLMSQPEKPFMIKFNGKSRSPKVTVVTIDNSL